MNTRTSRRGFITKALAAGGVSALPAFGRAASPLPQRRRGARALFVYGGWDGHQPAMCRDLFVPWLESTGYEVVVSDNQEPYADETLMKNLDLIVQIWTMGTIEKKPLDGLLAAVKGGVGLAGWHGGLADAYRTETEYEYMVGGNWVAHPGNQIDYRVHIVDTDDPITAGLSDFDVHSEQYFMHVNPNNHVLATTGFTAAHDPWIGGSTMPVAWKKLHGMGRVFYTSLGHSPEVFGVPEALTLMQRGMLWAGESRHEATPDLVSPRYPL